MPLRMPPWGPNRDHPLDHPTPGRPHRVYLAVTNHCNRSCPWCSTCSSPAGGTFLPVEGIERFWPAEGPFEVQLEGGEPTVHPRFWEFVAQVRAEPRCTHLVLCTNGAALPRGSREDPTQPGEGPPREDRLKEWLARLGAPLTVKLSMNHHLMERDRGLIPLARSVKTVLDDLGGERRLVLNVRLRPGVEGDDEAVARAVDSAGLLPNANVFYLQSYGFAADETGWEKPAPVWDQFTLVNPDGRVFGPDLVARSEAMRLLDGS